jgi:hypothetical protein
MNSTFPSTRAHPIDDKGPIPGERSGSTVKAPAGSI